MHRLKSRWNRWWFGFSWIILILLGTAAYSYQSLHRLRYREQRVIHSGEVLRQLELVAASASLRLIRARQLLAGNLGRSSSGGRADELSDLTDRLQTLVSDNHEQSALARGVAALATTLDATLREVESSATDDMRHLKERLEKPDQVIHSIRSELKKMRDNEEQFLRQRSEESKVIFRNAILTQMLSTLLAIAAAFSTIYLAKQRYAEQLNQARHRMLLDQETEFLLNSSSDGICGVNVDGVCTRVNLAGAQMLGYQVSELVGLNFHTMVHSKRPDGSEYPHQECPIYTAIKTASKCRIEEEVFWHRDGRAIPVAYAASPWLQHNIASGAVVSFSDISQRKQIEQQMIIAKQEAEEARRLAESASHAKSNFLASMSHELRTPLNAVIMYSEMLQEEAADLKLKDFSKDLVRIHTAGRHLLSLVNGVLDIAKIEAGKMELFIETVDIEATIQDVVHTTRSLVEMNQNQFVVELHATGSMSVDVTKFRQILLNLLSNAAKFTRHGRVTLRLDAIGSERDASDSSKLLVQVADTGTGIADESIGELFKPFVQAEKSTTREYGGTGLGLTLAKQFVELMGGQIRVKSEAGVGTTFEITIPRHIDDKEALDEVAIDGATIEGASAPDSIDVLVIDDDANSRDFVCRALEADGWRTISAVNGEQGLEFALLFRPKLIVLDILMPKMDGWAVLTHLKGNPPTQDIPVVLLTMTKQSELGFSLGAEEYLSKPVTREQLLTVAHRLGIAQGRRAALVVDDDPNTRTALERMLSKEGWHVDCAEDGAVALRKLGAGARPDMILLDLQMPVLDGFDFLAELRQRDLAVNAMIVVLTSRDLTAGERNWLAQRVEGILQKGGQSQSSLLSTLRSIIQRTQQKVPAEHQRLSRQ